MKIKTKLWLNAIISISLILLIGSVLILTSQKANDPIHEDFKTKQITQEVFDLNFMKAWRQFDAFSSKIKTTLMVLVLIVIGTAFIIVNSVLFSSRILKPITNLQKGLKIIGGGNLDYKVKYVSDDEIGELSKSFNQMSDKLKIQQNEFQSAKLEVEEIAHSQELANRHKTNFLSNVSHELRTPLNSLLLLTYSLIENKEKNLTENQKKLLRTIYSSGTELLALIRDVLDLSKIESGKVIYEMNKFSLQGLIDDVKDKFKNLADEKGLILKAELLEGLPEHIQADQQKVKQIINNLLSNAFKFTTQGSVIFRIRRPGLKENLLNDSLDPVHSIVIEVSDTGFGISKQHHHKVFEAFQQEGTVCQNEGTGLGLCISKELAKNLGGSIGLRSEMGKGSTFSIYLPENFEIDGFRAKKDGECLPTNIEINNKDKEEPFDVQLNLESKTILLVDDDARNVYALFSVLKKHGCTIVSAFDGRDALHYLNDLPNIDLVLMDIMMPVMDGYECIRAIRKQKLFKDLPIIALTAKALKADKEKCLEVGASDYLSKPATPSRLFPLLNKWLC